MTELGIMLGNVEETVPVPLGGDKTSTQKAQPEAYRFAGRRSYPCRGFRRGLGLGPEGAGRVPAVPVGWRGVQANTCREGPSRHL